MEKIGFIGLGKMGYRMSKRMMDRGYKLYVSDIFEKAAEKLVKEGAEFVANPAELAKKVNIIFTSVPSGKNLMDIIEGENGLLKTATNKTILVDVSTVAPKDSAEIAKKLETKSIGYLRSSVSGSTKFAEEGTLSVMVSGPKKLYEEVLPLLKIIGNRQRYLGEAEQSRYMKIAINMMIGTTMQMLAESLVMGEKVGIEWEVLVECIADSAAATKMIVAKEAALKKRDFTAMSNNRMMVKDMNIAMDIAKTENLCLPLTTITTDFINATISQGYGDLDHSAILFTNENLNNIKQEK